MTRPTVATSNRAASPLRSPRAGRRAARSTPTATPTSAIPSQPAPAASGTPRPAAEVYAEIRDAVDAIRGLQPTAAVDPVTIDEAQMRTNLQAEFDAAQTPAQLKDAEDLLITLGLLPSGASLRALTSTSRADQVAGYYSPEKDELFIVNRTGSLGPVDEATYAHEFTHQLQDQHFDLDALGIDAADQSDRGSRPARPRRGRRELGPDPSGWPRTSLEGARRASRRVTGSGSPRRAAACAGLPARHRDLPLPGRTRVRDAA